ncbi:hypothetical protein CFC21_070397 [Triticum aestivum]|uniref:Prefoldin subunit 3 n=3 Tax=Triticum TaxID=4564 RepID=A0A9R0X1K5_TRITD|nr:hypothetical protein CFC21_070397 [Triticum aestivum]VAI28372.1 unnamed protein product [Triticum turgidum subsp. durum]
MAAATSSSAVAVSTPQGVAERRGIPAASFVEDVETYLRQAGLEVNSALAFLQERLQQYKMVEMKLLAQQRELQAKIPDIEKCLDIVATLKAKKALVCLWLGANVMLEYSCDEANELLKSNLENARASLEVLVGDLHFLRDQQTITQVTIARIFNWDVHQRRSKQSVMKET